MKNNSALLSTYWILGQRIGIACQLYMLSKPNDRRISQLWRLLKLSNTDLTVDTVERNRVLEGFPKIAISHLKDINVLDEAGGLQSAANSIYRSLKWNNNKNISPWIACQLVANRLSSGQVSSHQLVRLARLEGRLHLHDSNESLSALNKLVESYQDRSLSITDRLQSIAKYRQTCIANNQHSDPLKSELNNIGWRQIENELCNSVFLWILVALGDSEEKGIAIPIIVDVSLDRRRQPTNNLVTIKGLGTSIKVKNNGDFLDTVNTARRAAISLWNKDASSWPNSYKKSVANCRVTLDFSVAEEILTPLCEVFTLQGQSLGASVSLFILSHFIDRTAMNGVCATGVLRYREEDRDDSSQADYTLGITGALDKKVAAASRFGFWLCLLPDNAMATIIDTECRMLVSQENNIYLSNYANTVFGQEIKRHTYIRCPDIEFNFKAFKVWLNPSKAINEIKNLLKANKNCVLQLPNKHSAIDIAYALKSINSDIGNDKTITDSEASDRLGTFGFIRAVHYEQYERFWWAVWNVLGGSLTSYNDFIANGLNPRHTKSTADLLGDALSRFTPTKNSPRRVPDVLVIIGTELFNNTGIIRLPNGPMERLDPNRLFEKLGSTNRSLRKSTTPNITEHIGNTRVILIQNSCDPALLPIRREILNYEEASALKKLAIFRNGFTFEHAKHMLNCSPLHCRTILENLCAEKPLRPALLHHAKSIGEYYLNVELVGTDNEVNNRDLHFFAAKSIASYLSPLDESKSINFREAFQPHWHHEAIQHLILANGTNNLNIKAQAIKASQRMSNVGSPFGWSKVAWALRFETEQNPSFIQTLRDHIDAYKETMHPTEWVMAAKYFEKCAARSVRDSTKQVFVSEMRELADVMISRAYIACNHHILKTSIVNNNIVESNAARFNVASTSAYNIMSRQPNWDGLKKAYTHNNTAKRYLDSAIEVDSPEWFEYMGDTCGYKRISEALEYYRKGLFSDFIHRPRIEIVVKYIGACRIARKPINSEIHNLAITYNDHTVSNLQEIPLLGLYELRHVIQRWKVGFSSLNDMRVQNFNSVVSQLEINGDTCPYDNTSEALEFYRKALLSDFVKRPRIEIIVKYIGACRLARERIDEDILNISTMYRDDEVSNLPNKPTTGLCNSHYIQKRWSAGLKLIVKFHNEKAHRKTNKFRHNKRAIANS
ncbi:MAG: hypothetical protein ABW148_17715 [Sedimenticola sp.]